jgi:hypothetical protein
MKDLEDLADLADLVKIAKELKDFLGREEVHLEGTKGVISYDILSYSAVLYEIKKDDKENVVVGFNLLFGTAIPGGEDTTECKKIKEFARKNNYSLESNHYEFIKPSSNNK